MSRVLASWVLGEMRLNSEIWNFLESFGFDHELCVIAVDCFHGEIYLLKTLEARKYDLQIAEMILPKLHSKAVLHKFMDMVYNHSQRLFREAMEISIMKEKGINLKSIEIPDSEKISVYA